MPTVDITSKGGPLTVSYTISTPNSTFAKTITDGLPTVVFLHAVFVGKASFDAQYRDPRLRRFNLIALDLRGHGDTVGDAKETYGVEEAADDVAQFLEALRLPPVHLMGVSLGAIIALEVAVRYPHRLQSLILNSCPSMDEPAAVAEGRLEIYTLWANAFEGARQAGTSVDEEFLHEAVYGALQLNVNNTDCPLVDQLTELYLKHALHNWDGAHLQFSRRVTVTPFVDRPRATVRGIACPVLLIHCEHDVAYPLEAAEEMRDAMEVAGVEVTLHEVPGAFALAHLSDADEINELVYDMVLQRAREEDLPPAPTTVVSPFAELLVRHDKRDSDDTDSASEGVH
ncbi:unnamed protein product [Mycena citricolor]|uniref:AB hydrolase-1 domain-containing protein n=1 Tax=Mycena citricolor TaxID=2018698 RepID=A0AAD2Q1Z3_9AGAR|nr:unnamed protein product [Mycena citricolor]